MLFHFFTFSDSFSCHECIVENFITDPIFSQPKPRGPLINFLQSSFCLLGIERVLLVPATPNDLDFVFQRVIGPSYVCICKNNGKYIYNVLVYNSMGRFGLCVHVQIICVFSFFFFFNQHLLHCL